MTTNQTIDGVPRELLERLRDGNISIAGPDFWAAWKELRALLDKKVSGDSRAPLPQGESVTIEAVAVTRENGEGGLRLEWLLEGGIAQMEAAGMVLFAIPEANDLCDEDGSAEVYLTPPQAEQPAPVAVVLPERYDESQYRGTSLLAVRRWNACLDEVTRLNTVNDGKARDVQPCCGSCPGGCVYGLKA